MTQHQIDFTAVRAELRALPRGTLLLIAERAIELVSHDQLVTLLGDIIQVNAYASATDTNSVDAAPNGMASLLDEVRLFHDAAMDGEYYEHVASNSKGRREQSAGTDAFIAEFDRLMRRCVGASEASDVPGGGDSSAHEVRDAFELLFALLRHIDAGNDDVLAFADDGSSLDVGVNWRVVLPAYFSCLAKTSSPEEFARTVDEAIANFVTYERPWYLHVARNVANDAQRTALDALIT
jgi:hypothetical protein